MRKLAPVVAIVILTAGCSEDSPQDVPAWPNEASKSGDAVEAAAADTLVLPAEVAPGFVYTGEGIDAYPNVAMICFGDRLRIYHISDTWEPATVAIVDGEDRVLRSFRMDLPPGGTVRAEFPEFASRQDLHVRVTTPAGFNAADLPDAFRPRIGFDEPELTPERLREMGLAEVEASASDGITINEERWSAATTATTSSLGPGPHIVVIGGIETHAVGVSSRAVLTTDSDWLEKARHAIDEVIASMSAH
jgi:hypothetical protein